MSSGPSPRPFAWLVVAGCLLTSLASACGDSGTSADAPGVGSSSGTSGTVGGDDFSGSGGAGAGDPAEREVESTYGAPVATGKYVWIANPSSGRVAYIDAATLAIKLIEAGDGPTFVAPVPDPTDDVAIVLNVRSFDATLLRASATGLTSISIPVPSSGNGWSVSADGHWAIAWTDARQITKPDLVQGYQDITVIDLTSPARKPTWLTVGYRPVAIRFDATASRAFAVTQDGISVVALTGDAPAVVKNVRLSETSAASAPTDVSITPDGTYALVRHSDPASVGLYSLADGTRTDVALPAAPSDLDLSPDGSTAVAVMRSTSQVALISIPALGAAPAAPRLATIHATVGSATLAPKSPVAFFYTNATPSTVLTTLDTSAATLTPNSVLLRAPILGVFPTSDAAHALVLHDALDNAGSHYASAVSLIPVAMGLPPKIIGLNAPVISVALSPAGDHALVATGDEATGVYQLMLASMPSLQQQTFTLASLPIAAGIVEGAGKGFVAQKHPDGRITFVNLTSGEARTITGFELATLVVDGTK